MVRPASAEDSNTDPITGADTGIDEGESPTEPGMYLRSLKIERFRSCVDVALSFQPFLTLIVGENNSGKSNIIDAVRLATSPLSRRRTRYFEVQDLSRGHSSSIDLTAEFDNLTQQQRGQFHTVIDLRTNRLIYRARFRPDFQNPRNSKVDLLAGSVESPDQDLDLRDRVNHVYLAPLRDAQRELDSAMGTRLEAVLNLIADKKDREQFLQKANDQLRVLEQDPVIVETTSKIQDHLSDLTKPLRGHDVGIGFSDYDLHRLARGLRLKMAEHGVSLADIADSGLGYANLLYMATVILELQNAKDSELTLFLVEEPEAHLHPQLQSVLLDYLQDQAARSVRDDSGGPAGRIQVIATTHSPNLASAVGTKNIVVLRTVEDATRADGVAPVSRQTVALPLSELALEADDRRKIDQYLDVTRAELLFTRRAVLVEGIAEAVILPALADKCVFGSQDSVSRVKRRAFHGVSIIPIGSVDFSPYVKFLLQPINGVRLMDRLVVVTDADPELSDPTTGDEDDMEHGKSKYNRRADLEAVAASYSASQVLVVAEATYTLEADLLDPFQTNSALLKEALIRQKPRSHTFWQVLTVDANPSERFYQKLRSSNGGYIRKGEFAHDVAMLIRAGRPFKCPAYLQQAITSALEGLDLEG